VVRFVSHVTIAGDETTLNQSSVSTFYGKTLPKYSKRRISQDHKVFNSPQSALLQPIFEPRFSEHSYGFRLGRGAHDAIKAASLAIPPHMSFPYILLHFEAQRAKKRLAQAFHSKADVHSDSQSPLNTKSLPVTNDRTKGLSDQGVCKSLGADAMAPAIQQEL